MILNNKFRSIPLFTSHCGLSLQNLVLWCHTVILGRFNGASLHGEDFLRDQLTLTISYLTWFEYFLQKSRACLQFKETNRSTRRKKYHSFDTRTVKHVEDFWSFWRGKYRTQNFSILRTLYWSQLYRVVFEESKGAEWLSDSYICILCVTGPHINNFTLWGVIEERKIDKLTKFKITGTLLPCSYKHIVKNLNFWTFKGHTELVHANEVVQTPDSHGHVLWSTQNLLGTISVLHKRGHVACMSRQISHEIFVLNVSVNQ